MKPLLVAAFICVFTLTGTAAFASDMQRHGAPATYHAIEGLGLLLNRPRTLVDEIFGPSTNLA